MTDRRVVMLGASGVVGQATLPHLLGHGHAVTAHSRHPVATESGDVQWVSGDIVEDGTALRSLLNGADVVIDLRVALPHSLRTLGAIRQYRKVRDEAFGAVARECASLGVPRLIHDTVTMIYTDRGSSWLTEASPVQASGPLVANLAGEQHCQRYTELGGVGVSLRLGMLYGDDPITQQQWAAARRGWSPFPGAPNGYVSRLAIADAGRAVAAAFSAPPGVYNVAETPRTRADLSREFAHAVGRESLRQLPGFLAGPLGRSQRVSSERFQAATGWRPNSTSN